VAEVQTEALQRNPEIVVAARRVAMAQAHVGVAGAFDDPSLMYQGWQIPARKPWDLNQALHMLTITQRLPGLGKRGLRVASAYDDVDVARAELEGTKQAVLTQVRAAFYALLRNADELRIHDEQNTLARQATEAARFRYVVGGVPQQDLLKAQIALTKLVDHLVMLQQDGSVARANLNTLMGRDPAEPLEVTGQYAIPTALPMQAELERTALQRRPELAAVTAAINRSESKLKLASKGYSPDVSISGGYMLMPSGSRFRNDYMAELSVGLPWLNRGKHESEIEAARAELELERAEFENQRAIVFNEIQQALIRANAAQKLVQLYRDNLRPQVETTLNSTLAAYQAGRTDFLNLLDSQNTTVDVELSYFRALSDFDQQMAELERAVGAPVSRNTSANAAQEMQR
jgi:outer membrane protein TolC